MELSLYSHFSRNINKWKGYVVNRLIYVNENSITTSSSGATFLGESNLAIETFNFPLLHLHFHYDGSSIKSSKLYWSETSRICGFTKPFSIKTTLLQYFDGSLSWVARIVVFLISCVLGSNHYTLEGLISYYARTSSKSRYLPWTPNGSRKASLNLPDEWFLSFGSEFSCNSWKSTIIILVAHQFCVSQHGSIHIDRQFWVEAPPSSIKKEDQFPIDGDDCFLAHRFQK